ncbi:MAG: hypothetical protein WEB58_21770, partial [Planctomycetaceae bacterium]
MKSETPNQRWMPRILPVCLSIHFTETSKGRQEEFIKTQQESIGPSSKRTKTKGTLAEPVAPKK